MMSPETARAHLHAAGAAAGTPSADLAATVLATRRHRRRRSTVIGGAVIAVLLVAVGVPAALTGLQQPATSVASGAGPIYSSPTRGGLADDAALTAGLQQLPWAAPDSTGAYTVFDAANPTASSGYLIPTDLAAAVPADQRTVVWVDDVPGGRWALLAIPTDGGYAAAWFTGPTAADAEQMRMSGPIQLVTDDEPMAHVDLTNPDKTLVVVAAPGATINISDNLTVQADGSTTRDYRDLPAQDGIAVTTLTTPVRYGIPATVQVPGPNGPWEARPTAAGQTAGVPAGSDFGYANDDPEIPSVQVGRGTSSLSTGRPLVDTMLASVLGPTGLTLQDLNTGGNPQVTEMFSGTRDGGTADPTSAEPADANADEAPLIEPAIAIWAVPLPSGAYAVTAGWAISDDPQAGQDLAYQQTLLTLQDPTFDPAVDLIATRMNLPAADGQPAQTMIVIAGDPDGATARLLDNDGAEVGFAAMRNGTATAPDPTSTVASIEILDATGRVLQEDALAAGVADLATDNGDDTNPTYLTTPITPTTAPRATTTETAAPTTTEPAQPSSEAPATTDGTQDEAPPTDQYGQRMADCLRPLGYDVTVDPGGESYSSDQAQQEDPAFRDAVDQCTQQTGYAPR